MATATRTKTVRVSFRIDGRVYSVNENGCILEITDNGTKIPFERGLQSKAEDLLRHLGFSFAYQAGEMLWRSPSGRSVRLAVSRDKVQADLTPLCTCGQPLHFIGAGQFPYECRAKDENPNALIFQGCDCGRTGWTSVNA